MDLFPTTHWSVVLNAADGQNQASNAALTQLCQTYWYPVYSFSRSLGDAHEDAEDLTQGFFLHLVQSRLAAKANPQFGKFRSFLLIAFRNFRSVQRRRGRTLKRGGGIQFIALDTGSAEDRYAQEPSEALTPERRYDRNWAIAVLDQAHSNLRREYAEADRGSLFQHLACFLPGREDSRQYDAVARELGKTVAAVKMEVSRMRQRYARLLRSSVAQTLAEPQDADEELHYLFQVLSA